MAEFTKQAPQDVKKRLKIVEFTTPTPQDVWKKKAVKF